MIDGGPSNVYGPFLKPRLEAIRKARGLESTDSLQVDLLMVSHIDDDHVRGILDLTKDLVTASIEKSPPLVRLKNVWHNTFDDIIGNDPQKLLSSITASFGAAALNGEVNLERFDTHTARVLASVGQGFQLRNDIKKLGVPLNHSFKGQLIMAVDGKGVDIGKGLSFVVAGPMKDDLAALQKDHDKFLKTKALASFSDTSVANLSSIVLMAQVGKKQVLLTGDARGDKILEGLEMVGLLKSDGKMHVDVLKVPHHGSDRNMETKFFERVTADHYVFSGNGEHGNPERTTLQMLLDARGKDAALTIHLTYPIDEIDAGREADAKKQGKKFSKTKDSLTKFFEDNSVFGEKISVVDAKKPHVIDLLEKVTF